MVFENLGDDGRGVYVSYMSFPDGTAIPMRPLIVALQCEGVTLEPDPLTVPKDYSAGGRAKIEKLLLDGTVIAQDVTIELTPERYRFVSLDFEDDYAENLVYSARGHLVFKPRDRTGKGKY